MMQPETYYLAKGRHVPNNPLPVLVYRNVLPKPWSPESSQVLCENNHWQKRGEWGVITIPHFHPNTHECYAIFRGDSRLVLGRERCETSETGVEVDVNAGDVIVIPAGVSHRSISSTEDYRYIGVYPETAPKWRNNLCKGEVPMEELEEEISYVRIPNYDPIFGLNGPLVKIWTEALLQHGSTRVTSKL